MSSQFKWGSRDSLRVETEGQGDWGVWHLDHWPGVRTQPGSCHREYVGVQPGEGAHGWAWAV